MDSQDARRPIVFLLLIGEVVGFQVAVVEDDHPPIMIDMSILNILSMLDILSVLNILSMLDILSVLNILSMLEHTK